MLLKAQKTHFFSLLLIFLLQLPCYAQSSENALDSTKTGLKMDSIVVYKGNLVAFKDTVFTNNDTLIIRKEVWIKEKDSLVISIDSVYVQGQIILFAYDTVFALKDTITIIQDTIISRNERVLRQIKEFSERDNLAARILKNFLVFEEHRSHAVPEEKSDKKFEAYEGKKIRNIEIKVLDVFGYSLRDSARKPKGFIEKGGNVMHIKSQRWLIRNRLLFKKGDAINSLKVAESERLLRDNNYIYDARIVILDSLSGDSVDVLVAVQDVWSISVAAGVDVYRNRYDASIRDVNFLGLGQMLDGRVRHDPLFGNDYTGAYTINNIYKTFVTGRLYYIDEFEEQRYGVQLNREFFSPAIKWAGGVNWNEYRGLYYLNDAQGQLISTQRVSLVQQDAWLGYGINISGKNSAYKGSRFIMSGRVLRNKYDNRPILPDTLYNPYYDSYFYLGSLGIIRRRYYKDSYIFRFGRTEDIPEGDMLAFTAGYEDRTEKPRPYLAINMSMSRYISPGYFYARVGIGGFYENTFWKEGVFLTHLLYFSPLIQLGKWKWRHFMGGRYVKGINRVEGEVIDINQEQGLRGFKSLNLTGTSKMVLNYEMNLFPPLNLLGFRMAFVAFADLAWIGKGNNFIDKDNFFPGYGVGIRFRNDHLIFNTIQLLLGFYPNHSSIGARELALFERSRFFYNYYNFQFSRPAELPFL